MVRQILDRLLLREHPQLGRVTERGRQQLHVQIILGSPDDLGNCTIRQNTQCTEVDDHRDVLAEPRHTRRQRVTVAIELGAQTNLQLLRRHRERLVQRLDLHRVRVLGRRLLVLEDHDPVVRHLLLTEDRPLGPVDDEVAQRIVGALTILRQAHRVVLQKTQTRSQHHGQLSQTNTFKHVRLLVEGIQHCPLVGPNQEANIHVHLRCIREIPDPCLHWKHGLHATRSLLDTRLDIRHILKGQLELILVLLGGLILLVPDRDGRSRLHNQRDLVANKVLIGVDLVIHHATNTIAEVGAHSSPFICGGSEGRHGSYWWCLLCK